VRPRLFTLSCLVSSLLLIVFGVMWTGRGAVLLRKTTTSFTTVGWEHGVLFFEHFHFSIPHLPLNVVYDVGGRPSAGRVFSSVGLYDDGQWGAHRSARALDRESDGWGTAGIGDALWFPLWLPMLVSAVLPAFWLIGMVRRRKRVAEGCCSICGYDLRATPDRCPECGREPVD